MTARRTLTTASALAALTVLGTANAGDTRRYVLEGDQMFVGVQVDLGKSQLSTISHALDGQVSLTAEGGHAKLTVPVSSFESGNALVDVALAKALEADKFAVAEFEGTSPAVGQDSTVTFAGTLRLHGVEHKLSVPVRVVRERNLMFAHLLFVLNAEDFGIERPSLGGVKAGDRIEVQIAARLHQASSVASN